MWVFLFQPSGPRWRQPTNTHSSRQRHIHGSSTWKARVIVFSSICIIIYFPSRERFRRHLLKNIFLTNDDERKMMPRRGVSRKSEGGKFTTHCSRTEQSPRRLYSRCCCRSLPRMFFVCSIRRVAHSISCVAAACDAVEQIFPPTLLSSLSACRFLFISEKDDDVAYHDQHLSHFSPQTHTHNNATEKRIQASSSRSMPRSLVFRQRIYLSIHQQKRGSSRKPTAIIIISRRLAKEINRSPITGRWDLRRR